MTISGVVQQCLPQLAGKAVGHGGGLAKRIGAKSRFFSQHSAANRLKIGGRWNFGWKGNSRPEPIGNVMENGFACVKIKIAKRFRLFSDEKRSNRWRVTQVAEKPLSRAADQSMCWTGIGAAVFDRRGGSHGLGGMMASGWHPSMSRPNDIA
jgi:hypothetical protein